MIGLGKNLDILKKSFKFKFCWEKKCGGKSYLWVEKSHLLKGINKCFGGIVINY